MANKTIADYAAAVSIDPVADYFLLQQGSAYVRINRNTILGITGTPADLSTVQTFSNKIIDNTNTINIKDSLFTIQDNLDTTKRLQFQLSGITTATTRVLTVPDRDSTIATLGGAQTFSGANSFTGSSWSGGTIDNATVTVDAVAGHTDSDSGTIYGISVANGQFNASALQDGTVTPAKLATGTGSSWVQQSYVPTLTNITLGNGTVTASWVQIGKTVFVDFIFVLGSSSAMGSAPMASLPVTAAAKYATNAYIIGTGFAEDVGFAGYPITVELRSTTNMSWEVIGAAGTYISVGGITASVPMVWGTGDKLSAHFNYEAA